MKKPKKIWTTFILDRTFAACMGDFKTVERMDKAAVKSQKIKHKPIK